MRLIFANSTVDWGGEKSWALETATHLARKGCECVMIGREGDRWVEACRDAGLTSHGIRFGPGIFNPLGIHGFHRVAKPFTPDCILVNIARDMCAGATVGRLLGVPVIRHVGLAEDLNHDPVDWFLHTRWLAGSIAVGHQMKRRMLELHSWLDADSVEVIHIGKDTELFRPGFSDTLRAEWGLSANALIVGVTSQLEPKKGHDVLLRTISRLRRQDVHLAIVGRGESELVLKELARELGLANRTHFLGFRRDIHALQQSFDIFALPSFSEGFPNTLVEAMAAGRACVATDLACVGEILQDGRNGLLAKAGDVDSMTSAITQLCAQPELRRSLGTAARTTIEKSFSLESTAAHFERYVEEIVEAKSASRGGGGNA